MRMGERYLKQFTEQVEAKYLGAIRKGYQDPAIILDVRDQEGRQRTLVESRGAPYEGIPPLVGLTFVGDRLSLAQKLQDDFGPNPAASALANEPSPEGMFPVIVVMEDGPRRTILEFYYHRKIEES